MIINARKVSFEEGKTILQVAGENNIYIPSLCYHKKTGPASKCRVCLVEVEGMRGLQTACSVPAKDGMEVNTKTEEIIEAQKSFINLLLSNGQHNCLSCEANGECELQQAAYYLGIEFPAFIIDREREEYDDSGEMIRRDPNKCIQCGRCIEGCNSLVVNEVLDFGYRGKDVKVLCDHGLPMGDSKCVQCGECSQLCPVGAIIDKKAIGKGRPWELEKINTTCTYCGVGCQLTAHVDKKKNQIIKITGREVPPNDGMLCVKGRYAYEFVTHPDRLKYPMIKKDGKHVRVSWDEALDYTAERIKAIVERHGSDVFSAFGSGRITNESNYAIMKFARAVIKTNNVDHCARTCHAPTVAGLAASFGSGAMTNSIPELEDARVIFLIGSNTTEAHPVISYYIKRAVKKGAILIVNDPRKIDFTTWATIHVQHKVGTDIPYVNGLINEIFKNGLEDKEYMEKHTENPDDIRKWVEGYTAEKASEISGVPVETIKKVARILGEADKVSVCYTLGITEHTCGTDNVKTLANLQMVLGNIGFYAAGLNPFRGQNNVQGACDMGALPNVYHNYQPVDNPQVKVKMEKAWGVENLPDKPGYKMPTMLRKALDGGTRVLYCIGDNTIQTEPHMAHTIKEIEALEFFICSDIFPTITTEYADVIFPDCAWGEVDGTFSNTERRVQRLRTLVEPSGECRPQWWVLQELAKRINGYDLGFVSSEAVWEDMRKSATSFAGITYKRIENIGIQWPCPTIEHPGTPFLHTKGNFTRGKGLFHKTDHIPPFEQPDDEYPFVLSTGRRLWHYHTATQTLHSEGFRNLFPEELLELNPEDAGKLGIKSGDIVKASSRRGEITLKAWVNERPAPGLCWCAFHFAEACANVLTIDKFDYVTETPEYKACAIKVEKVADGVEPLSKIVRQARP